MELGYGCVVDGCRWTMERTRPELRQAPVEIGGLTAREAVSAHLDASIAEGLIRAGQEDDRKARAHLESHDVEDFARTIARLRIELAQATQA
jgi:hypothetical protein